jgi:primary-amine oxidase
MSTQTRIADGPRTSAAHPLDPLTAAEYAAIVAAVRGLDDVHDRVRLSSISLREPSKQALAGHDAGRPVPRQADVVLHDPTRGAVSEAVVEVDGDTARVTSIAAVPGVQSGITPEEFAECARVVRADAEYRAGLARRGIDDPDQILVEAWGMGGFAEPAEGVRRLAWCPTWVRLYDGDNAYAHPIEGLYPVVDLNEMRVIRVEDHGVVPVPPESGDFRPEAIGPVRADLRPIDVVQPDGPSFHVDGWEVRWQRWRLRIGFTQREGLVLHTIGYEDGGRLRPILHRASIAELFIPYGDPSPGTYRKNAFDFGEYGAGPLTNSLELGCDCLGDITYFDVDLCTSDGRPYTIRNAICMHEEDFGILWKHTDGHTGGVEVRRSRRLVISSIITADNYDYGFYWYLYQDGSVEFEAKLTGIVLTSAVEPGDSSPYARTVAPGVVSPNHQHFFCARLDMTVDGAANTVEEQHTEAVPVGPENPHGNAFTSVTTPLRRELEARQRTDPATARRWRVVNRARRNRFGDPVGYQLVPESTPVPFGADGSSARERAAFADYHLWVTPYAADERYPTGAYPNQHPGGAGLPAWTAADRPIEDADVVLWHVFGSHHIVRPEEWPVMPVERVGFTLRPDGFFDRNPALDVPSSTEQCCHHPNGASA